MQKIRAAKEEAAERSTKLAQSKSEIQDQIIALLSTKPQEAMARMVEEYSGLVWKVAERYLKDPEDIKECLNDTFFELYQHRERFDPEKGSLTAFLAAIARNHAVSRYRKNAVRKAGVLEEDLPDSGDAIGNMDEKLDLEKALGTLKPEDAEIIRMKYYDGMTVQEIADSLKLPYETVKKRHQRSLGKMRLALILALLLGLALLTACAFGILRHLGIIPGFGVVDTSDPSTQGPEEKEPAVGLGEEEQVKEPEEESKQEPLAVYGLTEAVTVENETGIYTLEKGFWANGAIRLEGSIRCKDGETDTMVLLLKYGEEVQPCPSVWTPREYGWDFIADGDGIELAEENRGRLEITLVLEETEIELVFCPAEPDSLEGYSYKMGDKGGILALPRWEEGHFLVEIYPIPLEEYAISFDLVTGSFLKQNDRLSTEVVELLDASGKRWMGEPLPSGGRNLGGLRTWDFGEMEPGEYTLRIPYLLLERPAESCTVIPIDLEKCRFAEEEYQVAGGRIRVTDCRKLEVTPGEVIWEGEYAREGFSYWLVTMEYQETGGTADGCQILPAGLTGEFPVKGTEYEFGCSKMDRGDEGYQILVWAKEDQCEIAQFQLVTKDIVTLLWEHVFEIPVTADLKEGVEKDKK